VAHVFEFGILDVSGGTRHKHGVRKSSAIQGMSD
jgi:hypothetical protein